MPNKFQPWWLRFCVIVSFLRIIPVILHPTNVNEIVDSHHTVIIQHKNTTETNVIIKISSDGEIEIECAAEDDLNFIKPINTSTSTFKKLVIHHCTVPELSFYNFFNNLGILDVKSINFQFSNESPTNFQIDSFEKLDTVEILQLPNNNIETLPEQIFHGVPSLEELNLSHNRLRNISTRLFERLKKLRKLDLQNNYLETLPDYIFRCTQSLEKLDLSNNRLNSIKWDLFHRLSSLKELNLSRNELKDLDSKTFLDSIRLETIDLSFNQLSLEDAKLGELSPFITCLDLKRLILRNNSLRRVFADWRMLFNKLEELDLSFNRLENLTTDDFVFNTSNATINFSNNPLKIINFDDLEWKVKPPCIRSEFSLRIYNTKQSHPHNNKFHAENSEITCNCHALSLARYFQKKLDDGVYQLVNLSSHLVNCISPNTIRNIPLEKVNLSDLKCSIKELYPEEADKCPSKCDCHYRLIDRANIINCTNADMEEFPDKIPIVKDSKIELLFARNKLKSIKGLSVLAMKGNVTVISLSHNQIQNVDDISIPSTLEALKLDNNKISNLQPKFIQFLRSMKTLSNLTLHDNPWECNCDMQDLKYFILSHSKNLWIPDYSKIRCKNNKYIVIGKWTEDFCPTTFVLILKYIAIVGMISIPTIMLYYKYKRRIKLWMFTHKICLWLVTEKEIDKDKLYDAFVSFSHKDQYFVDEHLIPELEENGDHTFKLCIHYRDFVVGEYIPSQIIHSVENSRRTIIILTPNFLQSVWARMEFRMAHMQAIKERCARVIVILLDEVDDEQLDPELRAYIAMNTYVKWGDSSFWEKLRYALPHPQITCSKKNRRVERDILHEIELSEMKKTAEKDAGCCG